MTRTGSQKKHPETAVKLPNSTRGPPPLRIRVAARNKKSILSVLGAEHTQSFAQPPASLGLRLAQTQAKCPSWGPDFKSAVALLKLLLLMNWIARWKGLFLNPFLRSETMSHLKARAAYMDLRASRSCLTMSHLSCSLQGFLHRFKRIH